MSGISIIAKRLRQARERTGLSQKDLGIEAGINEFTASARMNFYEQGTNTPNLLTVTHIGAVLHILAPYFYCEDEQLADLILKYSTLGEAQKKRLRALVDKV